MSAESDGLPERIGPYRVLGRLGRGGMGEVLRAYDDRLDRPVALKRVLPRGRDVERARRRFRHEARAAARLGHRSIVQVYDWVETETEDGEPVDWLVMELVSGEPLDRILERGPLSVDRVLHVSRRLAEGLAAAHEAGWIHRDLKPSNVMVDGEEVKILDFGIARPVADADGTGEAGEPTQQRPTLTETGMVIGSVGSMSPEQALGNPVDARSDLFSLGCLIYEMASGVQPFRRDDKLASLTAVCTVRETPLDHLVPSLPPALADLVHQLLEKDPARRPRDAREVLARLEAGGGGEEGDPARTVADGLDQPTLDLRVPVPPVEAEAEAPEPETRPGRWRVLLLAGLGISLAVAALLALAVWLTPPLSTGGDTPSLPVPDASAPPMDVGPEVRELHRRGMEALERYDREGRIDEAIADFQRALALDQTSSPVLASLARAYWLDYRTGTMDPQRLDQARAVAERAVEHGPDDEDARVVRGLVLVEQGEIDAAAEDFAVARELAPDAAGPFYGLAELHRSAGDLAEAERAIRRALEKTDASWSHWHFLASLLVQMGSYEEAVTAYRRSLELAPENVLTLRSLGGTLYMQGDLPGAAETLRQALEIQPDPTIYSNLGTIYFTQGLYAQAVSTFEKAVTTDSGASQYLLWANLGDAYRWTPDNEEKARASFARALQLMEPRLEATPDDWRLRSRRILYLAKRGDCDGALDAIEAERSPPATAAYAWYRFAVAQEICGRRAAAFEDLERALDAGFAVAEIRADPELLDLRRDARFHPLVYGPFRRE